MTTNRKSGFVTRDRWWIPIVAATALVLLVFAGWHFFKPRPKPTPVPPAPVTATVMFKNGIEPMDFSGIHYFAEGNLFPLLVFIPQLAVTNLELRLRFRYACTVGQPDGSFTKTRLELRWS